MHPKDGDDRLDRENTMQFVENNALAYLAVDDLVWFKINRS